MWELQIFRSYEKAVLTQLCDAGLLATTARQQTVKVCYPESQLSTHGRHLQLTKVVIVLRRNCDKRNESAELGCYMQIFI